MFGVDSGHRPVSGGLARAAVFGVNDGLVSSAASTMGFAGSGVDSSCPAAGSTSVRPRQRRGRVDVALRAGVAEASDGCGGPTRRASPVISC
jgi:hypothetical protein